MSKWYTLVSFMFWMISTSPAVEQGKEDSANSRKLMREIQQSSWLVLVLVIIVAYNYF